MDCRLAPSSMRRLVMTRDASSSGARTWMTLSTSEGKRTWMRRVTAGQYGEMKVVISGWSSIYML